MQALIDAWADDDPTARHDWDPVIDPDTGFLFADLARQVHARWREQDVQGWVIEARRRGYDRAWIERLGGWVTEGRITGDELRLLADTWMLP